MEKLIKKLETLNAPYEIWNYGESYFSNAPEIHYQAIAVIFEWSNKDRVKAEREIEKYIKRSKNYVCFRTWYNLTGTGMVISRTEDNEAHKQYRVYMDASIKEWEEEAHKLYMEGRDNEVNGLAKAICDKYEKEYLKTLYKIVKTA